MSCPFQQTTSSRLTVHRRRRAGWRVCMRRLESVGFSRQITWLSAMADVADVVAAAGQSAAFVFPTTLQNYPLLLCNTPPPPLCFADTRTHVLLLPAALFVLLFCSCFALFVFFAVC